LSYSKLVADNEKLVFKFAPPQTERDDAAGGPHKSSPKFPKNLTKFTSSVYYYWWEFLRLNADYIDFCKRHGEYGEGEAIPRHLVELYRDFGDVCDQFPGKSDEINFRHWWSERGWVLFAEPDMNNYIKVSKEIPSDRTNIGHRIYLSMHEDADVETAVKLLKQAIKEHRDASRRSKNSTSFALYPPRHHNIAALARYLKAKKAQMKFFDENGKMPSYSEVVDLADLDYTGKLEAKSGEAKGTPEAKRKVGNELIKAADNIIAHVAYGIFPKTDGAQEFELLDWQKKCNFFPKQSQYMRFPRNWLLAIGWRSVDDCPLPDWRCDVSTPLDSIRQQRQRRLP